MSILSTFKQLTILFIDKIKRLLKGLAKQAGAAAHFFVVMPRQIEIKVLKIQMSHNITVYIFPCGQHLWEISPLQKFAKVVDPGHPGPTLLEVKEFFRG